MGYPLQHIHALHFTIAPHCMTYAEVIPARLAKNHFFPEPEFTLLQASHTHS